MMPALARFQDAFVAALYGHDASDLHALAEQPGFAVYRNGVLRAATDALVANFPTVDRLVGTDWLRAAAEIHARACPPVEGRLLYYGEGFPAFLAGFEPARDLPYLADVARLDVLWTQAHCEADEPALERACLAQMDLHTLAALKLRPRASVRWAWLPNCPAYTIWRANREQVALPDPLEWRGEGVLLTRATGRVQWQAACAVVCTFLDACAAGLDLSGAAARAVMVEPSLDLEALLLGLVHAGAFAALGLEPCNHRL